MESTAEGKEKLHWLSQLGLREFVALDLETTGLDAARDRIIEVGAVRFRDGVETECFEQRIDPGVPLDPFITALTGITDDDLRGQPPFSDIADTLLDFIGDAPIVGQNIAFDLEFLAEEGGRLRNRKIRTDPFRFAQHEVLDTAQLGRVFWPEWPRFGLATLSERFGVEQAVAHRALADARTTGCVLCHMIACLPDRVWAEMARDLTYLIEGTFDRSTRFFTRLAAITKSLRPPDDVLAPASRPSNQQENNISDLPSLENVFTPDGRLPEALQSYEPRPMQLQMAEVVREALEQNEILLCEAPTGVGKSLAYLVAAALWTLETSQQERQIVVSSHTKALQEQLYRKEMRTLQDLGIPVRGAVLKGRRNYICRRRLRSLINEARTRLSDEDRVRLMPLVRWAATTTTGDVSEMGGFRPNAAPWLWVQVCNDAVSCSGSHCGPVKGCFYRIAQERAARAQIVFINHALLFSDPSRFAQKPAPLRKFVLDEGHHIERAAVGAMSIELDSFTLRNPLMRLIEERAQRGLLARLISSASRGKELGDEAQALTVELLDSVRNLYTTVRTYFEELASALPISRETGVSKIRFRQDDRIHQTIARNSGFLFAQWGELVAKLQKLLRLLQEQTGDDKISRDLLLELRSSTDNMAERAEELDKVFEAADDKWVFWVEVYQGRNGSVGVLHGSLIFIGDMLRKNFWPIVDTATVTSATLAADGTFEHCRESLGLADLPAERLQEKILSTPFDLPAQMKLLVPIYLPHPREQSESWIAAIGDTVAEVVQRFRRGTLVLSTSLRLLDRLATTLEPVAQAAERTVLAQGRDGAPAELLEEFRRRKDAVLLGAANFWEGVDVVGEALQILIVTRLPFDVPTEPWIAARLERFADEGKDPFYQLSLLETILRLRQGLGRLIRHRCDRGIALILDSRIFSTRFGGVIRANLPVEAQAITSPAALWQMIEEFFREPFRGEGESVESFQVGN